ncbi:MAG TPA: hypothetical protein VJ259_05510 [Actinomycetota bacterium]|nr:hypothetical protein [Actinomycetota bacterium]
MEREAFEAEADRLLRAAGAEGVTLRLLGALAFKRRCPRHAYLQDALKRAYTDVDFAGYGKEAKKIRALLLREGYAEDEMVYVESEGSRMVLNHPSTGLHIDVFLDKLEFCHRVPWNGRLEQEEATIPLAEMLMQKMQIVQINEKDIIDTIMLLLEHPLGGEDGDTINIGLVAGVCGRDWGWWRTLTMNLEKVEQMAASYPDVGEEEKRRVTEQVDAALARIEAEPKSLAWKIRARVGDRKKWYRDVSELAAGVQEL